MSKIIHPIPNQLDNPHSCQRCAEIGPTCCSLDPGDEDSCFPLSRPEWERIVNWSEDLGAFAESPNSPTFINTLRIFFPGENQKIAGLFPEYAWHMRLAVDQKGACLFLGSAGCKLPREMRPWYCRIFPFWVRKGKVILLNANKCLAFRETRTIRPALALFDTSTEDILQLYGQLRLAWGLP